VFYNTALNSEFLIAPLHRYKTQTKQNKTNKKKKHREKRQRLSVSQDGLPSGYSKYSLMVYRSLKQSTVKQTPKNIKTDKVHVT